MSQQEESFDIHAVLQYLPHRYPFLLVDKIVKVTRGKHLQAIKNVTFNEPCFTGHFPDMPVMPGVLMIEALAQASGILSMMSAEHFVPGEPDQFVHLLASVDKARFRQVVSPGDQLILDVTMLRARMDVYKFACEASVDGEVVCSAEIMTMRRPKNT